MQDFDGRVPFRWIVMSVLAIAMAAVLLLAAVTLSIARAEETTFCSTWAEISKSAAASYGETPVSRGQVNSGSIIVVLAAPDGATFTIVAVGSGGQACVLAAGRGWEPGEVQVSGQDL